MPTNLYPVFATLASMYRTAAEVNDLGQWLAS